jgi:hypothetical protein
VNKRGAMTGGFTDSKRSRLHAQSQIQVRLDFVESPVFGDPRPGPRASRLAVAFAGRVLSARLSFLTVTATRCQLVNPVALFSRCWCSYCLP